MRDRLTVELADPEAILSGDGRNDGGLTRLELLRRAALGGGSALIGGGLLVSNIPAAFGQASPDREILNLLLLNESLEVAFYSEALSRGALSGRARTFARQVRDNETVHRDTVRKALGTNARPIPQFSFGSTTATQDAFLTTALALENNDVAVNNGAGPLLESKQLLAAAGAIVSVEARQAAWIRRIVYGPGGYESRAQYPAPAAFDTPITLEQAKAELRKTGFVHPSSFPQ
jgi:hypothetical protein